MTARGLVALTLLTALASPLLAGGPLTAPSVLLARALDSQPGHLDIGSNVQPIEGGALLTGWTHPGPGTPPEGLLLRVDHDGDVVWRRQPGTGLLWQVLPDPHGGYIVVGFGRDETSWDGWILHIDDAGNIDWQRYYGGPGQDRLTAIQPTDDGWIAVGQSDTGGEDGIDAWVLRIDHDGRELSSWTTGGAGTDRAFNIEPMPDGGAVIGGMDGVDPDADHFVTRLGPSGEVLWSHQSARPGFQVAHDVQAFPGGDLLVVGYGDLGDERYIDGFVQRITPSGEIRFTTTFGGPTYDRANHGVVLPDGSIAVIGYSQRPGATDHEHGWDMVFHRLDENGQPASVLRFGGPGYEYGRSVAGTPDDLWLIGHSSSGRDGSSVYLVRLDVTGEQQ